MFETIFDKDININAITVLNLVASANYTHETSACNEANTCNEISNKKPSTSTMTVKRISTVTCIVGKHRECQK